MISVWYLLWIVPLSVFAGYALCGLLSANGKIKTEESNEDY